MKTLVAGIGNIFYGDDGFGSEVAQRLAGRPLPSDVRVEDYGIRGVHLALDLLEGYDLLVLVDAVSLDREAPVAPGTVRIIEPDPGGVGDVKPLDAHLMDPLAVLAMVAEMAGSIGRVLLVGCEPANLEEGIGLSPAVADAVGIAARVVEDLISEREAPCSVV